jgi:hypothetical protein
VNVWQQKMTSNIFVEWSSTKERHRQPPPPSKFGNDCQLRACARAPAPGQFTFFTIFPHPCPPTCHVSKFYTFQALLNHRANAYGINKAWLNTVWLI